jgi:hypothetical protein
MTGGELCRRDRDPVKASQPATAMIAEMGGIIVKPPTAIAWPPTGDPSAMPRRNDCRMGKNSRANKLRPVKGSVTPVRILGTQAAGLSPIDQSQYCSGSRANRIINDKPFRTNQRKARSPGPGLQFNVIAPAGL